MAIETGQKIGEYEVLRRLGAGGLGVVYEVRHAISRRAEAMKILLPDQMSTPKTTERFRREVQLLATLNHPNIAALHNAFYHDGQLVMIMELIEGETLRDRSLRSATSLPMALHYATQILSAFGVAHRAGIVHRDVKPSNIMITVHEVVKLLDFGIAISDRSPSLTSTGILLGSLSYMSPEQVSGGKVTSQSDLYSLGVTLYELLTGKLPITGDSNYEIMTGHLTRTPPAPAQLNPMIPLQVSNAIMRAMAKEPAHRFESATEFNAALRSGAVEEVSSFAAETLPASGPQAVQHVTPSAGKQAPPRSSSETIQPLALEDVTRKLAIYIGPVAKFVVRKLAADCTDTDQLYSKAAKQITSETDRQKFLRSRHS